MSVLKFVTSFCFWLFLAIVMMAVCAVSIYVLFCLIRILRERHD